MRDLLQPFCRKLREHALLLFNLLKADRIDIINCRAKSDCSTCIDRSRLKALRRLCKDSSFSCHRFDHLAAA